MNIEQRLARGMALVPRLPDRTGDDVGEDLRALYTDIEQTLRVPFVNFIFRMLVNFPDYFRPAWAALAPRLRTLEFEQAADRLRAAAAEDVAVKAIARDTFDTADLGAVVDFTDSIHYVLPKLLLTVTALDLQLNAYGASPASERDAGTAIDAGVAEGTRLLALVDPAHASERIQSILDDIRDVHGHPGVASYYRGLANVPAFLEAAWSGVRSHIGTDAYGQRKQSVLLLAEELASEHLLNGSGVPDSPDRDDIGAVLAVFRYRLIPDLLLDVTLIKAMLDGPEAAGRSRFSVA